MARYKFRLFVAGPAGHTLSAVANMRAIGSQILDGDYELQIVDILESPEIAERERISLTPTLIMDTPLPSKRLVGDLSHTPRVLAGLGIGPSGGGSRMQER